MTIKNAQKIGKLFLDTFNVNETMAQLKAGGVQKMMSWGFRHPTNFENKGLLFRVSGLIHKGYVLITLDFNDTYTVHLLNLQCDIVKKIEMVYCDELTEKIDEAVEKNCNDEVYKKKVDNHYKIK